MGGVEILIIPTLEEFAEGSVKKSEAVWAGGTPEARKNGLFPVGYRVSVTGSWVGSLLKTADE
jgi:hypothetical protein